MGSPLIAKRHYHTEDGTAVSLLGFEQFGFVYQWRAFLQWFQQRLRLLNRPVLLRESASRAYLRALSTEIRKVFSREHLLYQEEQLCERVVQTMEERDLSAGAMREWRELTKKVFANAVLGRNLEFRTPTWKAVDLPVDCPTVEALKLTVPPWLYPETTATAQRYAEQFHRLSQHREPEALYQELQAVAATYTRATSTRASL